MKIKYFLLSIVFILIFSLSGCALIDRLEENTKSENITEESILPTEPQNAVPSAITDTFNIGQVTIGLSEGWYVYNQNLDDSTAQTVQLVTDDDYLINTYIDVYYCKETPEHELANIVTDKFSNTDVHYETVVYNNVSYNALVASDTQTYLITRINEDYLLKISVLYGPFEEFYPVITHISIH